MNYGDWDRSPMVRKAFASRCPKTSRSQKIENKKTKIKVWLLEAGAGGAKGWSADRFGHLQKKTDDGKKLRLKFGKAVVRLEKQLAYRGEWRWLRSEYYGKLTEERLLGWPNVV